MAQIVSLRASMKTLATDFIRRQRERLLADIDSDSPESGVLDKPEALGVVLAEIMSQGRAGLISEFHPLQTEVGVMSDGALAKPEEEEDDADDKQLFDKIEGEFLRGNPRSY